MDIIKLIDIGGWIEQAFSPKQKREYFAPELISEERDGCGHVVRQTVRAVNMQEATKHLNGYSPEGNNMWHAKRTGEQEYTIKAVPFDLESAEQKRRRADMERRR